MKFRSINIANDAMLPYYIKLAHRDHYSSIRKLIKLSAQTRKIEYICENRIIKTVVELYIERGNKGDGNRARPCGYIFI